MNRWYNKQVSTIKENKPQGFWNKKLAAITEKRNRQVKDGINKVARIVINHCLKNNIGTIIFGWNKRHKDSINIGKKNNSEFVPIPTERLKDRIAQLCEQYGLLFLETEESYTSRASFLDCDYLPTYGAKPKEKNTALEGAVCGSCLRSSYAPSCSEASLLESALIHGAE